MASRFRRLGAGPVGSVEGPPDTRPIGSLFNADPSSAVFAQNIHRVDLLPDHHKDRVPAHVDMFDADSGSIATTDRRTLRMHDPLWVKRHPEG